ncbi:MAG: hypothetical protein RBT30_01015 [Patescibacteria group bacterium]|jgi:hypothetical protein|nr:hypothetical protein [Patescibacteria group bacterium]
MKRWQKQLFSIRQFFSLKKNFFLILAFNFILIALLPLLIRNTIFGISENFSIFILSSLLLITAYLISLFYLHEIQRLKRYQLNLEDRLQETFKYIGSVNLQMEEMKASFSNFKKYPENKKDIKTVFNYFAEKIMTILNVDWLILRVIDINNAHSLRDERYSRNNKKVDFLKIDNKDIIAGKCSEEEVSIIQSEQSGFYMKSFCILPFKLKNKDQEFFVKSMVSQLEMLYIVFSILDKKKIKKNNKIN